MPDENERNQKIPAALELRFETIRILTIADRVERNAAIDTLSDFLNEGACKTLTRVLVVETDCEQYKDAVRVLTEYIVVDES